MSQTQIDASFEEDVHPGTCLRVGPGEFRVFPDNDPYLEPFKAAIRALNPVAAVKLRTHAIRAALAST